MPWCIAQISTPIPRPRTSSCSVFHTHQDPDQLIGQTSPVRGCSGTLVPWRKIKHTVVLRPRITSDIEPREPEILGGVQRETEPRRHANCDGTIIRLLRVPSRASAPRGLGAAIEWGARLAMARVRPVRGGERKEGRTCACTASCSRRRNASPTRSSPSMDASLWRRLIDCLMGVSHSFP